MCKWTDKMVNSFSQPNNIRTFIFQQYFPMFKKGIAELCDNYFPRQMAAYSKLLHIITNDERTFEELEEMFLPLQEKNRKFQKEALLFKQKYIDRDVIDKDKYLLMKKMIEDGKISDEYLARQLLKENANNSAIGYLRYVFKCLQERKLSFANTSGLNFRKTNNKHTLR